VQYAVEFRPSARKSLASLPRRDQLRIAATAEALGREPRPIGAKKLAAEEGLWRIRIGSYRLIYKIEDDKLVILVLKIGHRKDVYR
jgi:mRNA interferase RelE/StbE